MLLKGKKIVVVGLARSGVSIARFLKNRGALVRVTDQTPYKELGDAVLEMERLEIPMELGGHKDETFANADLIVLSPGVPHTIAPVKRAAESGIPVIGEIELAARFIKEPMIAVTGTNGKTTTVTLLSEMLKESGFRVFIGGNIGTPLIEYVEGDIKADFLVVELSSFQLDTIESFRPNIAILLNITEDHMNRYSSFDAYVRSKGRIFENQEKEDIAIFNRDAPHTDQIHRVLRNRTYMFSSDRASDSTIIDGDSVIFNISGFENTHLDLKDALIFGKHNRENIAAAAMAALSAGASIDAVQRAVNCFKGLPHRIEYAHTIRGIKFYNDSKATNVDAVIKALDAFKTPVILIMGGRDKGVNLGLIKESLTPNIKLVIAIGESKKKIKQIAGGIVPTWEAASMEEAVLKAYHGAARGDSVLLSPACASFDMFNNYNHRGEVFCKAVSRLKERVNE